MKYSTIQPLSQADRQAGRSDLPGLLRIWQERRQIAERSAGWKPFMQRLVREVAIETGLIERLYVWDRGLTETMIQQGVDAALIRGHTSLSPAAADRAKALIDDHTLAIEGLFHFVKGGRQLSESYVKELHSSLTRGQGTYIGMTPDGASVELELPHGRYKIHPNSPQRPDGTTHAYCPPEFVNDEMERLICWFDELDEATPPDVAAAWLHHRFTQVHPFQDGNGRVARALASMVMIKAGGFPLVIRSSERERYFVALERADEGDLGPLSQLIGEVQVQSIRTALDVELSEPKTFDEALQETARTLESLTNSTGLTREVAARCLMLQHRAAEVFGQKEQQLKSLLASAAPELVKAVRYSVDEAFVGVPILYFQGLAESRGYRVDWKKDKTLLQLLLPAELPTSGVVAALVFHGLQEFDSMMGVMAFAYDERAGHRGEPTMPHGPVADEFAFLGDEEERSMVARFDAWLEPFLVRTVDYWRRKLAAGS